MLAPVMLRAYSVKIVSGRGTLMSPTREWFSPVRPIPEKASAYLSQYQNICL